MTEPDTTEQTVREILRIFESDFIGRSLTKGAQGGVEAFASLEAALNAHVVSVLKELRMQMQYTVDIKAIDGVITKYKEVV